MKLLEAAARKTILGVLLLLLKELRRLATAVETITDSYRTTHGHQPMFSTGAAQAAEIDTDAGRHVPRFDSDDDRLDWLRNDVLEALCREHHIIVTDGMDLVQIGRERGWLDSSGQLVTLPAHYGD